MWGTINKALNRGKQKSDFPSLFTMNGRELTDSLVIVNEFDIFLLQLLVSCYKMLQKSILIVKILLTVII